MKARGRIDKPCRREERKEKWRTELTGSGEAMSKSHRQRMKVVIESGGRVQ